MTFFDVKYMKNGRSRDKVRTLIRKPLTYRMVPSLPCLVILT